MCVRTYCCSTLASWSAVASAGHVVEVLRDVDLLRRERLGHRALRADVRADRGVDRRGDVAVGRHRAVDRRGQVRVGVDVDVGVEQAAAVEQGVDAAGACCRRPLPTSPAAPPTAPLSAAPSTASPTSAGGAVDRAASLPAALPTAPTGRAGGAAARRRRSPPMAPPASRTAPARCRPSAGRRHRWRRRAPVRPACRAAGCSAGARRVRLGGAGGGSRPARGGCGLGRPGGRALGWRRRVGSAGLRRRAGSVAPRVRARRFRPAGCSVAPAGGSGRPAPAPVVVPPTAARLADAGVLRRVASALPLSLWSMGRAARQADRLAPGLRTLAVAAASIGAATLRLAAAARSTGAARSSPRSTLAFTSRSESTSLFGRETASSASISSIETWSLSATTASLCASSACAIGNSRARDRSNAPGAPEPGADGQIPVLQAICSEQKFSPLRERQPRLPPFTGGHSGPPSAGIAVS